MSIAIGIDLGTTNTVVAAVVNGVAVTLEDKEKRKLIPSIVSFHPSGSVLVGDAARERRIVDPENTIFSIKRLIGRAFASDEVKQSIGKFPFRLMEGPKNSTMVMARDVAYALPEISAFVLRRAKAIAEAALGDTVDRAVITVPANFNDLQRASTKIAGKLAGLDVLRILNEPTAAALAYGQSIAQAERIAVYDLGGGTFDITLLDLSGSVFEVLSTAGDTSLGGDDIDMKVADLIADEVMNTHLFDPRTNAVAYSRLRVIAESLKQKLSRESEATVEVDGIGYGDGGVPLSLKYSLTRDELEKIAAPLIQRTIDVTKFSIETIGKSPKAFDRIIMVGGSTRMPLVSRMVEDFFAQAPNTRVNPDEVVALGAAIQAYSLNRAKSGHAKPQRSAAGKLAASSIAAAPEVPAAPPGAPGSTLVMELQKTAKTITFSPAPSNEAPPPVAPPPLRSPALLAEAKPMPARKPPPVPKRADLTPPPAVLGALPDLPMERLQPSAVQTRADAPLLIDVTPLSLRVETVGGFCDALIEANSPVPCDRTRVFLTAADKQTAVYIRVAQGESNKFAANTFLGELELSGLPPRSRGELEIAVTFELDADGILNVKAVEKGSGVETRATMRLLGAATDLSDVDQMMARQAQHAVV